MIIRVTRDIVFGGVVRLGEGAVRVVADDDFVTNGWGPDGATRTALFVPVNVTDPSAGHVALEAGDWTLIDPLGGSDDGSF
tara:strand:+ start:358 stop:600 length:243 start_codon:yes stop_codon:yes gene_type:complete